MNRVKGILYAALSSSTFGLVPFFTILLLAAGFSSFELLTYRFGVAAVIMLLIGRFAGCSFRLSKKEFAVVFMLSVFYTMTAFSLVIAYRNIASGVASIIHFMYPLAVSQSMIFLFKEKRSVWVMIAVLMSLLGACLLSSGDMQVKDGNAFVGIITACISVFSYAAYIICVRKTQAVLINSTVLTSYVMGIGAVFYAIGALCTSGLHIVTDGYIWLIILGLALPATAISNIALVLGVKYIGPTLTSIFGALEPLMAVIIGVMVFNEAFTKNSVFGILLIITAVCIVVLRENKK